MQLDKDLDVNCLLEDRTLLSHTTLINLELEL